MLRWSLDGETLEHESPGCRDAETDFAAGERVEIRFDPDDPSRVFLATWWSVYSQAVLVTPIAGFLLLMTVLLLRAYRYRLAVARA